MLYSITFDFLSLPSIIFYAGGYDTAVAQLRPHGYVTTFDGNTFKLQDDSTYYMLGISNVGLYVYARQMECGDDPKTFRCFQAFMFRVSQNIKDLISVLIYFQSAS